MSDRGMTDGGDRRDDGPRGRADLHIHTLASDGTAGVEAILDHVERADRPRRHRHHRPRADRRRRRRPGDGARPRPARARSSSARRSTTLGGHLLALFLDRPIRPYRSLRTSILAVHEAGRPGDPGPSARAVPAVRPGLDRSAACSTTPTRPPTPTRSRRSTRRASASPGTAASSASPTSTVWPTSATATPTPSRRSAPAGRRSRAATRADLRRAIETRHERPRRHLPRDRRPARHVRRQLRKRGRDARDEVAGRVRRDGTGRDHGYPGGRHRPPRFETPRRSERAGRGDEDRSRLPVHLPGDRRRRPARPPPVREPAPARPRRPDHHRQPRPAARVGGRHPADRRRLLACR